MKTAIVIISGCIFWVLGTVLLIHLWYNVPFKIDPGLLTFMSSMFWAIAIIASIVMYMEEGSKK